MNNNLQLKRQQFVLRSLCASLLLSTSLWCVSAQAQSSLPSPPIAKIIPKITEINGYKLVDNYFWLRDKNNPEVKAYLEAENAYTAAVMKPTIPFQDNLYDEMLKRIKETDINVPYANGKYLLLFS